MTDHVTVFRTTDPLEADMIRDLLAVGVALLAVALFAGVLIGMMSGG